MLTASAICQVNYGLPRTNQLDVFNSTWVFGEGVESARGVAAIVVFCRNSSCNSSSCSCDAIVRSGQKTIPFFLLFRAQYRRNLQGWFPKVWFWRMFPQNENPERGCVRMFPRNENRNEGTLFACSPRTKTGTRAHSPRPPFTKPPLLSPGDNSSCAIVRLKGRSKHVSSVGCRGKHCNRTACRFHPSSKHPRHTLRLKIYRGYAP